MSRRSSTSPASQVISQVMVDTGAMTPETLRFPNGHLCNLHKDNRDLMLKAAAALGIEIQCGAPRNVRREKTKILIGIYLQDLSKAAVLMDKYRELMIAAYHANHANEN